MENIKDFDAFYALKILPVLDVLKAEDKQVNKWGIGGFISFALAVLCIIGNYTGFLETGGVMLAVFFGVCTVVSIYFYTKSDDDFNSDFKEKIIREIIQYLLSDVIYKPGNYTSSKEYKASSLYRHYFDYYEGDDYVEGQYKGVSFHCSQLDTSFDSLGRRNRQEQVFKGLFFVAFMNSNFAAGTYVWARGREQLGATIGDERYRLYPMPHVMHMKMNNPAFEKYFSVYGTDPSEAGSILTERMMALMLQFKAQIKRDISFSFVAGRCYVAIPIAEDLLEPATDIADKEEIKKYFFTILLILSIINSLELTELA